MASRKQGGRMRVTFLTKDQMMVIKETMDSMQKNQGHPMDWCNPGCLNQTMFHILTLAQQQLDQDFKDIESGLAVG